MSLSLDKNDILETISKVSGLAELETLRVQYLGKKGLLTSEMKSLSLLSFEEKKEKGRELNIFKNYFENKLSEKKTTLEKIEDLELLRFTELGYVVRMIPMSNKSISVDTKNDVKKVEKILLKK